VLGSPVDVLGELFPVGEVLRHVHRLAGLSAEVPVDAVADHLLVLLRNPQQHSDHTHRHLRPEIVDEVEATCADEPIQAPGAELADLRLERGDFLGHEHPGQQAAVDGVGGRVLER
jgi:hypothetical protein